MRLFIRLKNRLSKDEVFAGKFYFAITITALFLSILLSVTMIVSSDAQQDASQSPFPPVRMSSSPSETPISPSGQLKPPAIPSTDDKKDEYIMIKITDFEITSLLKKNISQLIEFEQISAAFFAPDKLKFDGKLNKTQLTDLLKGKISDKYAFMLRLAPARIAVSAEVSISLLEGKPVVSLEKLSAAGIDIITFLPDDFYENINSVVQSSLGDYDLADISISDGFAQLMVK